ncbi:MAG: DHA2 family efflux MFS transporter permease subunit [Armatimonadota bacterium]|nr:DHA2 family efflux MFS transporter permease subunit [Armatimonadota bacterium]
MNQQPDIQEQGWCPIGTPGIVALSVMLATFMEVLDTTVVNVSLPHISGNLSATIDETTWVITSYLVSNAIVLPATGWLSRVFGRKKFYMTCVAAFAVASFLCGLAPSLPWLVFFRVLQGLCGGALQPISQAILLESFPLRKRGMGMAIFGIGVVFAPIIGPTLGGWITDNFTWRWIFYINIPVSVLSLTLTEMYIVDPPYLRRGVTKVDYAGLGLLAVGIGALQIVLDNGQRKDWFETSWITQLSIIAVVCLIALVVWERRAEHPIIDLSVFKARNFAPGALLIFMLGIALYGSLVLLPIFLQNLLGYTAMQSGLAMSPGGIGTLIFMPLVGYLVGKRDARYLIIFGLAMMSTSMFMMSHYNLQISFWHAMYPRIVMGMGLAFLFVPIATATFAFTPREQMGTSTGLFNLMRNVGGSFGIAGVTTMLARRAQFHQSRLGEHITGYNPFVQEAMRKSVAALVAHGQSYWLAQKQALGLAYFGVLRQAALMSFVDCFRLLGVIMLVLIPVVFIMRRPPRHGPATGH